MFASVLTFYRVCFIRLSAINVLAKCHLFTQFAASARSLILEDASARKHFLERATAASNR